MHSHVNRLLQQWKTMPMPDMYQSIFEFQFIINWFCDLGISINEEMLWADLTGEENSQMADENSSDEMNE